MDKIEVAAIQMTSGESLSENIEKIESFIQDQPSTLKWVFFPENCLFFKIKSPIPKIAAEDLKTLVELAKDKKINIHLGSVPIASQAANRFTNTSVIIESTGKLHFSYSKLHLFDVGVKGEGKVRESDHFFSGTRPKVYSWENWKMGQAICYDIRFGELFADYANRGVDITLIPAAFLVTTGRAHWNTLVKARAIETQSYVVAAAQWGTHQGHVETRSTYGHSQIVDPWGEVISLKAEGEGAIYATLEKNRLQSVRNQIPMNKHRKSRIEWGK